jgi:hypothetical protein
MQDWPPGVTCKRRQTKTPANWLPLLSPFVPSGAAGFCLRRYSTSAKIRLRSPVGVSERYFNDVKQPASWSEGEATVWTPLPFNQGILQGILQSNINSDD